MTRQCDKTVSPADCHQVSYVPCVSCLLSGVSAVTQCHTCLCRVVGQPGIVTFMHLSPSVTCLYLGGVCLHATFWPDGLLPNGL